MARGKGKGAFGAPLSSFAGIPPVVLACVRYLEKNLSDDILTNDVGNADVNSKADEIIEKLSNVREGPLESALPSSAVASAVLKQYLEKLPSAALPLSKDLKKAVGVKEEVARYAAVQKVVARLEEPSRRLVLYLAVFAGTVHSRNAAFTSAAAGRTLGKSLSQVTGADAAIAGDAFDSLVAGLYLHNEKPKAASVAPAGPDISIAPPPFMDDGDPDTEIYVVRVTNFDISKVTPTTKVKSLRALYPFEARKDTEISMARGDIIEITYQDDGPGWWEGTLNGKNGLFPSNYCDVYELWKKKKKRLKIDTDKVSDRIKMVQMACFYKSDERIGDVPLTEEEEGEVVQVETKKEGEETKAEKKEVAVQVSTKLATIAAADGGALPDVLLKDVAKEKKLDEKLLGKVHGFLAEAQQAFQKDIVAPLSTEPLQFFEEEKEETAEEEGATSPKDAKKETKKDAKKDTKKDAKEPKKAAKKEAKKEPKKEAKKEAKKEEKNEEKEETPVETRAVEQKKPQKHTKGAPKKSKAAARLEAKKAAEEKKAAAEAKKAAAEAKKAEERAAAEAKKAEERAVAEAKKAEAKKAAEEKKAADLEAKAAAKKAKADAKEAKKGKKVAKKKSTEGKKAKKSKPAEQQDEAAAAAEEEEAKPLDTEEDHTEEESADDGEEGATRDADDEAKAEKEAAEEEAAEKEAAEKAAAEKAAAEKEAAEKEAAEKAAAAEEEAKKNAAEGTAKEEAEAKAAAEKAAAEKAEKEAVEKAAQEEAKATAKKGLAEQAKQQLKSSGGGRLSSPAVRRHKMPVTTAEEEAKFKVDKKLYEQLQSLKRQIAEEQQAQAAMEPELEAVNGKLIEAVLEHETLVPDMIRTVAAARRSVAAH